MDNKSPNPPQNPRDPLPQPPSPKPQTPKPDYSDQLFTGYGTKKDTEKLIQNLLGEIHVQNVKGREKAMKKIYERELKARKVAAPTQDIGGGDIPIDGDIVNGTRAFMKNCISCHSLETNNQGYKSTGPALGLIYGRKAGIDPYFEYSEGLLKSNFVWNERRLFNFMKNPKEMIPDVRCEILGEGVESAIDRADLTKFLKKFTKELHRNLRFKANNFYGKEYVDNHIMIRKGVEGEEKKRTKDMNENERR